MENANVDENESKSNKSNAKGGANTMSRMNGKTRKRLYQVLVARSEEFCSLCGAIGTFKSLCLDHRDNCNGNNDLDNLQLLCRSCNAKKNPRGPAKPGNRSLEIESSSQSEEVRLNKIYEPAFRKWIKGQVRLYERILLRDAKEAGAEISGASILTIERYLRKMCSMSGELQVVEENGKKYVETKEWLKED